MQINIKVFYNLLLSNTMGLVSAQCNIPRKKWVLKLTFCVLINIKLFWKLILSFLIGLVNSCYHFWLVWLSMPKVPKFSIAVSFIYYLCFINNYVLMQYWMQEFVPFHESPNVNGQNAKSSRFFFFFGKRGDF